MFWITLRNLKTQLDITSPLVQFRLKLKTCSHGKQALQPTISLKVICLYLRSHVFLSRRNA